MFWLALKHLNYGKYVHQVRPHDHNKQYLSVFDKAWQWWVDETRENSIRNNMETEWLEKENKSLCVCVCVRACVRACVHACVRVYTCVHRHFRRGDDRIVVLSQQEYSLDTCENNLTDFYLCYSTEDFHCSFVGGISAALTTPLDVAKTRIMLAEVSWLIMLTTQSVQNGMCSNLYESGGRCVSLCMGNRK